MTFKLLYRSVRRQRPEVVVPPWRNHVENLITSILPEAAQAPDQTTSCAPTSQPSVQCTPLRHAHGV